MPKKLIYICITLILLASQSYSFMSIDDTGTAAGSFLKLGAGARAAGLGEACSAVVGNANSVYWNPAGLNEVKDLNICLQHSIWFEGLNYEWAAVALRLNEKSAIGIGVQYMGYGDIVETDDTGLNIGTFAPMEMAVIGSFGTNLGSFKVGISAKYMSFSIKNTATAFSFDTGILREFKQGNNILRIGLTGYNLIGTIKYIDDATPLPLMVRLGAAYNMGDSFLISTDITAPSDGPLYFAAGMEYRLTISKELLLMVRGGYNTKTIEALGVLSGMAAGGGLKYGDIQLDYAYKPYGDLGTTHRFSVSMDLGNLLPEDVRKEREYRERQATSKKEDGGRTTVDGGKEKIVSGKEALKGDSRPTTDDRRVIPVKKIKKIIKRIKSADVSTTLVTITPDITR